MLQNQPREEDQVIKSLDGIKNQFTDLLTNIKRQHTTEKMPAAVRMALTNKRKNQKDGTEYSSLLIPGFIKNKFITMYRCGLCQQPYLAKELETFGICGHKYCVYCLNTYCSYKIDVLQKVICPCEPCNDAIDTDGPVFQKLPQKSKDRFKTIQGFNPEQTTVRHCQSDYCGGLVDTSGEVAECPLCFTRYCKECHLRSHEQECSKHLEEYFKTEKQCPNCHVFVEKQTNGNHMFCECGKEFCFICQSNWNSKHFNCQNDSILRHQKWISTLSRAKQIQLGLAMIPLFPVSIVFLLIGLLVILLIGLGLGLFVGTVMLMAFFGGLRKQLKWVLFPVFALVAGVIGVILALVLGILGICVVAKDYLKLIPVLLNYAKIKQERNKEMQSERGSQFQIEAIE